MTICELAKRVPYPTDSNVHPMEKLAENDDALYNYCTNHVEELLAISNDDGYHIGMAFAGIVSRMSVPIGNSSDICADEKFKFSLYSAVFCLGKGIQLETILSCIAAETMIKIIDRCKEMYFYPMFLGFSGLSIKGIMEENPESQYKRIETTYYCIKYYLKQLTRAEDSFKDADLAASYKGQEYMKLLMAEMEHSFRGYLAIGIL